jgi:hypothetical protein
LAFPPWSPIKALNAPLPDIPLQNAVNEVVSNAQDSVLYKLNDGADQIEIGEMLKHLNRMKSLCSVQVLQHP